MWWPMGVLNTNLLVHGSFEFWISHYCGVFPEPAVYPRVPSTMSCIEMIREAWNAGTRSIQITPRMHVARCQTGGPTKKRHSGAIPPRANTWRPTNLEEPPNIRPPERDEAEMSVWSLWCGLCPKWGDLTWRLRQAGDDDPIACLLLRFRVCEVRIEISEWTLGSGRVPEDAEGIDEERGEQKKIPPRGYFGLLSCGWAFSTLVGEERDLELFVF